MPRTIALPREAFPFVFEHAQDTLIAIMPDRTQPMDLDPFAPGGCGGAGDDINLWTVN